VISVGRGRRRRVATTNALVRDPDGNLVELASKATGG
jgi:hypothetical protein